MEGERILQTGYSIRPCRVRLFGRASPRAIVVNSKNGQRHIFGSSAFHCDNGIGKTRGPVREVVTQPVGWNHDCTYLDVAGSYLFAKVRNVDDKQIASPRHLYFNP